MWFFAEFSTFYSYVFVHAAKFNVTVVLSGYDIVGQRFFRFDIFNHLCSMRPELWAASNPNTTRTALTFALSFTL